MTKYGTLENGTLHTVPRAVRIGGAAALPSTKLIYQAFIDAIDRIKQRLDQEGD